MSDQNASLVEQLEVQNKLLAAILEAVKEQGSATAKLQEESAESRRILSGLKTIAAQPLTEKIRGTFLPKQLSFMGTLEAIANEELSFARFGDGELRNMFRPEFSIYFQKNSAALASDLRDAMAAKDAPNMLVGLPNIFADHLHWTAMFHELWDQMAPIVDSLPRFGNLHVTRPVGFQAHGLDLVDAWRRVWENKAALIVTGKGSRFDLEPALFDNLKSSRTEYSTPQNAYADLARVEKLALDAPERLVMISLGPAGSVLAHRLAKAGKQALDLGHLSSSYKNILKGGAFPERTPVSR